MGPVDRTLGLFNFLHACLPFCTLASAIDADYEWMGVVYKKDWGKLIPPAYWHVAGREQLILVSGIGSPWEPGGTLCPRCVPLAVLYCVVSFLTGRPKDHVLHCVFFGSVLFAGGMRTVMLDRLLVTLR